MDSNSILFTSAIALMANGLIFYVIISFATKADKRAKYEWGQLQLLAKIARAQGISDEEIESIFKVVDR